MLRIPRAVRLRCRDVLPQLINVDGSLQDRELMAKDEDLSLAISLVTVRSDPEDQPEDEVADREEHRRMILSPTSGIGTMVSDPLIGTMVSDPFRSVVAAFKSLRGDGLRALAECASSAAGVGVVAPV